MKKAILISMAWALALLTGCSTSRPAVMNDADRATATQVDNMLTRRLYKVDFTMAYPVSSQPLPLTSPYFISVSGDKVESYLPYFGRAYSAEYGGGEGLRFDAPITGYTDAVKRNGQREIEFTAITDEDSYEFSLTISPLGGSNLTVTAVRKQAISFSGQVDMNYEAGQTN